MVVVGGRAAESTETELANSIHISTIYTSADCIARKRPKPDGRKSRNPYKVNLTRNGLWFIRFTQWGLISKLFSIEANQTGE